MGLRLAKCVPTLKARPATLHHAAGNVYCEDSAMHIVS